MPKAATDKAPKVPKEKAEKKPRAAKKEKDGPKRPLSAFMYFCKDWRERVKAENPEASFGELGKLLGAKWKELEEGDKADYLEEAAKDKQRYDGEKEAGGGGGSTSAPKKSKKKKPVESDADEDDEE